MPEVSVRSLDANLGSGQGRFYSWPLDDSHLWAALRYAELNPVRAGPVATAERWPWSSVGAHGDTASPNPMLDMEM